jgi:hypothetical protein
MTNRPSTPSVTKPLGNIIKVCCLSGLCSLCIHIENKGGGSWTLDAVAIFSAAAALVQAVELDPNYPDNF